MASEQKLVCLEDYEARARSKLKESHWNYYADGSCLGLTAADNVKAYKRYYILPRILRDVSRIDTSTTLLGQEVTFPIGVSPAALRTGVDPDGEMGTGRASMRSGVCMIQSIASTKSIEQVTEACNGVGLRWMQLRPIPDRSIIADIVSRAERLGYKAIVLTCDQPRWPIRYSTMGGQLEVPQSSPGLGILANFPDELNKQMLAAESVSSRREILDKYISLPGRSWEWVDWLRSITSLPIVLKGILHPDDAREALRHDIQAILVSNHGGRALDEVPATIDALPEIVEAVNGKIDVYIDGGIRHGTDVFKALALGAKAVFIGRPIIWGLACDGENGAYDVLQLLGNEFRMAMTFAGCSSIAEITTDFVRHASHYTGPFRSHK